MSAGVRTFGLILGVVMLGLSFSSPTHAATRNAIDSAVQRLDKGDPKSGMQPYSDNNATPAGRAVSALDASWKQLDADIGKILSNKAVVLDSGQSGSLEAGPIVRKALETYLLGR